MKHLSSWASPFIVALLAVGACGGDTLILPEDGEPATLEILAGNGQADTVGRVLRDSLVVRITDPTNRPVKGLAVRFLEPVSSTGARTIPDTAHTDADGRATARWVLGTVAGPQSIRAKVAAPGRELSADFHAAAIVAEPDTIVTVSGDSQSGGVGTALGQPLVVRVTDRYGNPVSGVAASWRAVGGGSVSATTTKSGSGGEISALRTLGPNPGGQQTVVTATGLRGSPLAFVHTASQGAAANLIAVSGNNQSGEAGQPLAHPLVVRLVDALGNGLAGRAVAWPVASGGGTISGATITTDATGRASATWTLGPIAGVNIVIPASSGFTATFTASSSPSQPTTIAANTPTQLTGTAGAPASPAPSVRVSDAQGRPVPGVLVTFAVTSGGGSLAPAAVLTNANGDATVALWTLGTQAGTNGLSASAQGQSGGLGGSPVRFTATASAGPMSRLAITTPPSSSAASGVPLARPPVVQLQDAHGNDVGGSGVVVTATIAGSPAGASLTSATATTNSTGAATLTGLTLTGPAATYTLVFTSNPSLTSATSNGIVLSGGGSANSISVLIQPSASTVNGAAFLTQPSVLVVDQNGLPAGGVSVSASESSSGVVLGGQVTSNTNSLGIATFSGLSLTGTVGSYALTLSAGALSTTTTNISLTPGPASASQSTANVPANAKEDDPTVFTVTTRDQSGNDLTTGGHTVEVRVTGRNQVNRFTASDNGNGTYSASYTPRRNGFDQVHITLDGTPIAGSPYPSDVDN